MSALHRISAACDHSLEIDDLALIVKKPKHLGEFTVVEASLAAWPCRLGPNLGDKKLAEFTYDSHLFAQLGNSAKLETKGLALD